MEWEQRIPQAGDIIRVKVRFYHHYGIFVDEQTVIEFGKPENDGIDPEEIRVQQSDLQEWEQYGVIESMVLSKDEKKRRRSPQKTLEAARARLGEGGYNILHNNCEHFATSCLMGDSTSHFLDAVREKIRMKIK